MITRALAAGSLPIPFCLTTLQITQKILWSFLGADLRFLNLKQKWIEIVLVFFSGIVAWFLAYILKNVFMTSRPFLALPDVTPLWVESGFAFPSGHATFFMALGFAIYLTHKKIGYIFISFAILIGLARIIAGVHFPVDILGGFILGIIVAYLVKHLLFFQNRLE